MLYGTPRHPMLGNLVLSDEDLAKLPPTAPPPGAPGSAFLGPLVDYGAPTPAADPHAPVAPTPADVIVAFEPAPDAPAAAAAEPVVATGDVTVATLAAALNSGSGGMSVQHIADALAAEPHRAAEVWAMELVRPAGPRKGALAAIKTAARHINDTELLAAIAEEEGEA